MPQANYDKNKNKETTQTTDNLLTRLDKKNRSVTKRLHENGKIYILYSALDAINLSNTATSYVINVIYTNTPDISTADIMHDWMMSPIGIIFTAVQSSAIILFSILGNYYSDKDPNYLKRILAILWPYFRELKGLKNSYKGIRSFIQVINILGKHNVNFLILPLALPLGGLSVADRIWMRYVVNERKQFMKENLELLLAIENQESLTATESKWFAAQVQRQSLTTERTSLLLMMYGGAIDSLYLYMGVLTLCSLAWPALALMSAVCLIYSISCITTRLYEEYDNQRKLQITHAKIELALYIKEKCVNFEKDFSKLEEVAEKIVNLNKKSLLTEQEKLQLVKLRLEKYYLTLEIKEQLTTLGKKKEKLESLMTLSFFSACLNGLKNGLAAYGALTSSLFMISTVMLLLPIAFPPALLIACISSGLILLTIFVIHSVIKNYFHHQTPLPELDDNCQILWEKLDLINNSENSIELKDTLSDAKTVINQSLNLQPKLQSFIQEWLEIIRAFFSGLSKGPKFIDFIMNPLQEPDPLGHYHDTTPMIILSLFSSVIYSITYALRADTRGFGRPSLEESVKPRAIPTALSKTNKIEMKSFEFLTPTVEEHPNQPLVESSTKESGPTEQKPDSKIKRSNSLSQYSFFNNRASSCNNISQIREPSAQHALQHYSSF